MSDAAPRGWLDRMLNVGVTPDDDADMRVRKRVGTGAIYALLVFGLAWLTTAIVPLRLGQLLVSTLFFMGTLLALVGFVRTKDFERFAWWELVVGLAASAFGQVALGGFVGSSGSIVWGVVAPVAAVLFFGPQRAMRWFVVYLVLIGVLVALDPLLKSLASTPYALNLWFWAINTAGPVTISFLMIRYVDRERRIAQARSRELLLNVLPASIADRLQRGEGVIAEQHPAVSVLFADVVDFTPYAEATPPTEVVQLLNAIFSDFDALADRFGMEKIKTIGDAYMAVAGVPTPRGDHADCAVRMGLAMLAAVGRHHDARGRAVMLRVGIASGAVVAGVIGRRKFIYDLWGDTVNTASRMESSGIAGCIQVTAATRELLAESLPFRRRDDVPVKGKGMMTTYVLDPAAVSGIARGVAAPDPGAAPTPA
jgi:adenylate cyclase